MGTVMPSTEKRRHRGIDPDVLSLAEKFVEDDAGPEAWSAADRDSLAEEIQRTIEDWFEAR